MHDADCRTGKRRDWLVAPFSDCNPGGFISSSSRCRASSSNPSSSSTNPSSSCRCPLASRQAPAPLRHQCRPLQRHHQPLHKRQGRVRRQPEQYASYENLHVRGQRYQTPVRARGRGARWWRVKKLPHPTVESRPGGVPLTPMGAVGQHPGIRYFPIAESHATLSIRSTNCRSIQKHLAL